MGQQFQISFRRGSPGERLWLSGLVQAMEQVSEQDSHAPPRGEGYDGRRLAAFRAQLALPAPVSFTSPLRVTVKRP